MSQKFNPNNLNIFLSDFANFLTLNGTSFDEVEAEYYHSHWYESYNNKLSICDRISRAKYPTYLITDLFCWEFTNAGAVFWNELEKQWKTYLQQRKRFNIFPNPSPLPLWP